MIRNSRLESKHRVKCNSIYSLSFWHKVIPWFLSSFIIFLQNVLLFKVVVERFVARILCRFQLIKAVEIGVRKYTFCTNNSNISAGTISLLSLRWQGIWVDSLYIFFCLAPLQNHPGTWASLWTWTECLFFGWWQWWRDTFLQFVIKL